MTTARHKPSETAAAIYAHAGNITRAAAALGITRQALLNRIHGNPELRAALDHARGLGVAVESCPECHGTGLQVRGAKS